jgi:hypothetical protein
MSHQFDDSVLAAVLRHMNADHAEDSLLIARAFAPGIDIASATMTGFDGDGGTWLAVGSDGSTRQVRVGWPDGPITERPDVRRQIVALYDDACRRLGVEARPHA